MRFCYVFRLIFVFMLAYLGPMLEAEPIRCDISCCPQEGVECFGEEDWNPNIPAIRPLPTKSKDSPESAKRCEEAQLSTDLMLTRWPFIHFLNVTKNSSKNRPYFEDYYALAQTLFRKEPPKWKEGDVAPNLPVHPSFKLCD